MRKKKLKRNDDSDSQTPDSAYDDTYDKEVEAHGGSYDKYDNSIIDDDGATPAKEESADDSKNLYREGRANYHKKAKKEFVDNLPSEDEPESDEDDVGDYLSDAGEDSRLRK